MTGRELIERVRAGSSPMEVLYEAAYPTEKGQIAVSKVSQPLPSLLLAKDAPENFPTVAKMNAALKAGQQVRLAGFEMTVIGFADATIDRKPVGVIVGRLRSGTYKGRIVAVPEKQLEIKE